MRDVFGVGMAMIALICNNIVADPYAMMTNNIFVTLLLVAVLVWLIELRKTDKPKGNRYLALFAGYQVLTTILWHSDCSDRAADGDDELCRRHHRQSDFLMRVVYLCLSGSADLF